MAGDAAVLRPTKGIHIVVPRERLRTESIVAFFWEGRPFFAVPAGRHTYVGTTDTDWTGDPGEAVATTEDVSSVLAAVNASFDTRLGVADVTATWAGVRPLIAEEGSPAPSDVSRDYEILEGPAGVYTICGGKLTTARSMAQALVDRIAEQERGRLSGRVGPCRTNRVLLPGAPAGFQGYRRQAVRDLQRTVGLAEEVAGHLVDTYGTRHADVLSDAETDKSLLGRVSEGSPVILADAAYAASREVVVTLEDFMRRRSDLMLFGAGADRDVAGKVAGVLGRSLAWDAARAKDEVDAYMRRAEGMLSFRQPAPGVAAATDK
jgi:glycerol-3-phosphate dehydrogenase